MLVQVHQHVLLQTSLAIGDADAIIMPIETVNESLYGWLVKMTKIRSCLARFVAHYEGLRVNEAECVNDNFAFYRLYRINDNGNGARSELFEGLLSVDVDGG